MEAGNFGNRLAYYLLSHIPDDCRLLPFFRDVFFPQAAVWMLLLLLDRNVMV